MSCPRGESWNPLFLNSWCQAWFSSAGDEKCSGSEYLWPTRGDRQQPNVESGSVSFLEV